MCLIVFAHHTHPKYPFILLANRDEYHERPTQQMDFLGGGNWILLEDGICAQWVLGWP